MPSLLKAFIQSVNEALFPPKCYVCKRFLKKGLSIKDDLDASYQRIAAEQSARVSPTQLFAMVMRPVLCDVCIEDFLAAQPPLCPQCGKIFINSQGDNHLCGDCLKQRKIFNRARSVGVYAGSLLALIHQLKYYGRIELARPLGELLFRAFVSHWEKAAIDVVVPVPLHRKKLRKRGFNQTHLLLSDWEGHMIHQNRAAVEISDDILQRSRWTTPQTGLGRRERRQNIKGAFCLNHRWSIKNRTILLVDDVYTTGATVTECAHVLTAGGAKQVDVLTLARAI